MMARAKLREMTVVIVKTAGDNRLQQQWLRVVVVQRWLSSGTLKYVSCRDKFLNIIFILKLTGKTRHPEILYTVISRNFARAVIVFKHCFSLALKRTRPQQESF